MAPLLSRTLDPLLGIGTGVFAYYLYESNPRTVLPEDQRLSALLQWRMEKWRQERERTLMAGEQDVDLTAVHAAVEKA